MTTTKLFNRKEVADMLGINYSNMIRHLGWGSPGLPVIRRGMHRCLTFEEVCMIARWHRVPEPTEEMAMAGSGAGSK